MDLKLYISLALCSLVSGRGRGRGRVQADSHTNEGLQKVISNLQLLIPFVIRDSLTEEDDFIQHSAFKTDESYHAPKSHESYMVTKSHGSYNAPKSQKFYYAPKSHESYLVPKSHGSYHAPKYHDEPYLVPKSHGSYHAPKSHESSFVPKTHLVRPIEVQYYPYQDGAFSDIPNEAFTLDEQQPKWRHETIKKDKSHPHDDIEPPRAHRAALSTLIRSCVERFRGGSQPRAESLEVSLDLCAELLDVEGIEAYEADDITNRNSAECLRCDRHGRHEPAAIEHRVDAFRDIGDVFRVFRPLGGGKEWMALNSQNPDNN